MVALREVGCGSFDSVLDGEHNDVSDVEISNKLTRQGNFFFVEDSIRHSLERLQKRSAKL